MHPRLAFAAVVMLLGLIGPAAADAIDGHWCDDTKQHLEINGPEIVTPSGAALRGDYNRHGFKYQEPADGKAIVMVLLNEVTMRMKAGDGPDEIWHRCAAPISQKNNDQAGTGSV
jgi:hypothetical protein